MKSNNSGFTLIELLVVIAIIGLLSSIVLVSMQGAREKARDARRIQEITQIQTAVELYYDTHGQYPLPAGGSGVWSGHCPNYGNYDKYILGLELWLPNLPLDPKFDEGSQCYLYRSNGIDYIIITHFTMESVVGGDPSAAGNPTNIQQMDRICCWQPTIAVYSSGARNW
ncbi:MAG: type II secretion system protein [Patescibacteria group bacterium]|nr:type II secretion system GspH family protein [Patescibacteria group bacterium]MBU1876745.1 type II secretion system GspH family protein [Patescibacteria group bacterium]